MLIIFSALLHLSPVIKEMDNYSIVEIQGIPYSGIPGSPMLPLIPFTGVKSISIVDSTKLFIKKPIFPVQKQYPISLYEKVEKIEFISPVEELYREYSHLPVIQSTGYGEFLFRPVRILNDSTLIIYDRIEVEYQKPSTVNSKYDYLIVTDYEMKPAFLEFAKWKEKLGIRTKVVVLEEFIKNYSGMDSAERLRNALKDFYSRDSFKFLLLGGDTDIIPFRYAFAMSCEAGYHPREDNLPCDLYFADLDGDWNRDGDMTFGEVEDSIDLYPEIMVGRAPVRSVEEAQLFCQKVEEYERGIFQDYQRNLCFSGSILWTSPYTDGGVAKDRIERYWIPSLYSVEKVYERDNKKLGHFINSLNKGANFINQNGHGWINTMQIGGDYIYNETVDSLENQRYGILYSVGCWTGAFDYDCLAEHFLRTEGGVVAYIGNSSYGWGSPGNPGFGYSDIIDEKFFSLLFTGDFYHIGEVFYKTKEYFIPLSRDKNLFRWHEYEVNLFADPAMKLYTDFPQEVDIVIDSLVFPGNLPVYILQQGKPVEGAIVSLIMGDSLLHLDTTDVAGRAEFQIEQTMEDIYLWISGKNIKPESCKVNLMSTGEYIKVIDPVLKDRVHKGDTVMMEFKVTNQGNLPASSIRIVMEVDDTDVVILDHEWVYHEQMKPGDTVDVKGIRMVVNGYRNSIITKFTIESDGSVRKDIYSLNPCMAWVELKDYTIEEPPTDMEEGAVELSLYNPGLDTLNNVNIFLLSDKMYSDTVTIDIRPHTLWNGSLILYPIDEIEQGEKISVVLVSKKEGYRKEDTLEMVMGPTSFYDDFENGLKNWTITVNSGGQWHLTEYRSNSGDYSLYPGKNGKIENNLTTTIVSDYIYMPMYPVLSLYRYLNMPNYGTAGLYVIVENETKAETLDFIGAGGALTLPVFSNWNRVSYDIREFSPGDRVRIKLSFINFINETYEGIYVDDISLDSRFSGIHEYRGRETVIMKGNTGKIMKFEVHLDRTGEVLFEVYSIAGRRIYRRFLKGGRDYLIRWPAVDNNGRKVGAGIYYVLIKTENEKILKKVVVIK